MLESRQILNARLEHQLGTLVSSVEIAIRANLASSNVAAENTLMELLNRIHGWNLVNANSISQNYAGVDLIDEKQQIAVQVTSTRTTEKVRHTLAEVSALGIHFQRVIVLFISNRSVTQTMRDCAGTMELWNIPDVYRDAIALDTDRLREIIDLMNKELGTIRSTLEDLPHLELPIGSRLQSSGFVGREEELEKIRSRFAAGDKLVVLTGLGGMGKTELAVHYAREHPGIVHFVRFDTSFTRTLANMAQSIRPRLSEDALREDESARSRRVLALLKESHSGDLLIIDNADGNTGNLADLQRDPGYDALTGLPLKLLITTRSYAPRAIRVEPMSEENLKKIFHNHGATLTEEEMIDLIRAVNRHTMTIDLIARTLTARGWRQVRAEHILTALREHTLPSQKYQKITTDYSQSPDQAQIYTHLSVVFDVSGVPEDGQQVLRCATLLPEDGMDAEVFGISLEEAQQNALDDLLNRGWLEIKDGLLIIHPVICLVCQTEIPPKEYVCAPFLIGLIRQYDMTNYRGMLYRQIAQMLTKASLCFDDSNGLWATWSGMLWNEVGNYVNALECLLRTMEKLEEKLPPDSPNLATTYNNVGTTYGKLGDRLRALEYQLKALAIQEKVLPADHPTLSTTYANVGVTYGELGNHPKALEYRMKALTIREKTLPSDHPDLATAYNNVGTTYCDLGDYKKALGYLQKGLNIREKVLAPDHPLLAQSYNNVGSAYGELGDHEKDIEYQKKSLAIHENVLPADHPNMAQSYISVGTAYGELGDHEKELEYTLKALEIREKVFPADHPELAQSYNSVGSAYHSLGDHKKAIEYVQKALIIRENVLPKDHPALAATYTNLAWTYYELENLREAARYMRRAADIVTCSTLPETHHYRVKFCKWADRFEQELGTND